MIDCDCVPGHRCDCWDYRNAPDAGLRAAADTLADAVLSFQSGHVVEILASEYRRLALASSPVADAIASAAPAGLTDLESQRRMASQIAGSFDDAPAPAGLDVETVMEWLHDLDGTQHFIRQELISLLVIVEGRK